MHERCEPGKPLKGTSARDGTTLETPEPEPELPSEITVSELRVWKRNGICTGYDSNWKPWESLQTLGGCVYAVCRYGTLWRPGSEQLLAARQGCVFVCVCRLEGLWRKTRMSPAKPLPSAAFVLKRRTDWRRRPLAAVRPFTTHARRDTPYRRIPYRSILPL